MADLLTRTQPATAALATARAEWLVDALTRELTSEIAIDVGWREQRQHNRARGGKLRRAHREHYEQAVLAEKQQLRKLPVSDLLSELSLVWGLTWSDASRMLNISVPALRKWRRDENGPTPDNRDRLAGLVAFLRKLKSIGVADPAAWMAMPLDSESTVCPRDLYREGHAVALIDYAAANITSSSLLDESEPHWREKWRREFDVVVAEDGHQSLIRRDSGSRASGEIG